MHDKRILLIDDDEDDQEIFLSALSKVSSTITCTTMSSASSALRQLKEGHLSPDVIFLDLNMPVMNGQQFLLEIKKDTALHNIPIIIFSTTSHQPTIQLTKDLGARDFITKPEKFDDLVAILTLFMDGMR